MGWHIYLVKVRKFNTKKPCIIVAIQKLEPLRDSITKVAVKVVVNLAVVELAVKNSCS